MYADDTLMNIAYCLQLQRDLPEWTKLANGVKVRVSQNNQQ